MVLDCEIFSLIHHLVATSPMAIEESAVPLIDSVGPGGHYLSRPHTLKNMRRQWMPDEVGKAGVALLKSLKKILEC